MVLSADGQQCKPGDVAIKEGYPCAIQCVDVIIEVDVISPAEPKSVRMAAVVENNDRE